MYVARLFHICVVVLLGTVSAEHAAGERLQTGIGKRSLDTRKSLLEDILASMQNDTQNKDSNEEDSYYATYAKSLQKQIIGKMLKDAVKGSQTEEKTSGSSSKRKRSTSMEDDFFRKAEETLLKKIMDDFLKGSKQIKDRQQTIVENHVSEDTTSRPKPTTMPKSRRSIGFKTTTTKMPETNTTPHLTITSTSKKSLVPVSNTETFPMSTTTLLTSDVTTSLTELVTFEMVIAIGIVIACILVVLISFFACRYIYRKKNRKPLPKMPLPKTPRNSYKRIDQPVPAPRTLLMDEIYQEIPDMPGVYNRYERPDNANNRVVRNI